MQGKDGGKAEDIRFFVSTNDTESDGFPDTQQACCSARTLCLSRIYVIVRCGVRVMLEMRRSLIRCCWYAWARNPTDELGSFSLTTLNHNSGLANAMAWPQDRKSRTIDNSGNLCFVHTLEFRSRRRLMHHVTDHIETGTGFIRCSS